VLRVLVQRRRVVLPLVGAVVCIVLSYLVAPVVTWILLCVAFALLFDGITMMWPQGDNLTKYRQ
jgi:hypothetical protein